MSSKKIINMGSSSFYLVSSVSIIQNEENNIVGLLDNVYDVVDEIILLDGGSTDNTVELIKSYTDTEKKIKLFAFPFNGHFGDQKNLALSKTNSLFSLVIDADERLNKYLRKDFSNILLKYQDKDLINFYRYNYIDHKPEDIKKELIYRLFKSFCRYIGSPHEEIVGWEKEREVILDDKYFIVHDKSKEKSVRNNNFYQRKLNIAPHKNIALNRAIKYA